MEPTLVGSDLYSYIAEGGVEESNNPPSLAGNKVLINIIAAGHAHDHQSTSNSPILQGPTSRGYNMN